MTTADAVDEPVLPRYFQASLADLLPSLGAALGVEGCANVLGVPPLHRACVLLVDGLGQTLLRDHRDIAPYLNELADAAEAEARTGAPPAVLTAGCPSTTVSSLTSLGTGLAPGGHGILGCTTVVPETGALLNHLTWDQQVDPHAWQPHDTVFARAALRGVDTTVVSASQFRGTGLTEAALRGADYRPADTPADRVEAALAALDSPRRALVYVYVGDLDGAGHRHGTASAEWRGWLERIDGLVAELAERQPSGTGLFVTGDHGMVDVPPQDRHDADTDEAFTTGVTLLGGENRLRHVYTRPGAAADVLAAWRERLGEAAWVHPRDEAVDAGWFGPVTDRTRPRIGDVVAAMRGTHAVVQAVSSPGEAGQIGMHGSLTAQEQWVPLVRVFS